MNRKKKKFSVNKLRLTDHFIERYHQRVLEKSPKNCDRKSVSRDIRSRLTHYEKQSIILLANCNKKVSIPLGMTYTMVIKNGTFVTVY